MNSQIQEKRHIKIMNSYAKSLTAYSILNNVSQQNLILTDHHKLKVFFSSDFFQAKIITVFCDFITGH